MSEPGQAWRERLALHPETAVLENCGDRFDLHTHIDGWVESRTVYVVADAPEDQSPRDAAVADLAARGWSPAGDGSWWVHAWTGPGANVSWAILEPVAAAEVSQ